MTEPTEREIGANLAELYLKGKVTMPALSGEISSAATSLGGVDASALSRSTNTMYGDNSIIRFPPGFNGYGPGDALVAACSDLSTKVTELADVLKDCGANIIVTAQDYARTDADVRAAFIAEGGKL